jgi:HTH-type transcriptional regulator/antitoxin HigA
MFDMNDIPTPGYFIREELEARDWTQRDLAFVLGIPEQAVNMLVSGKRGISADMARSLGEAFDVSAEFFANLQKVHDLSRARDPDPGVTRKARLQSSYPLREMIKRGWFVDSSAEMLEAQMARFFGKKSTDEIPHMAHAAKRSNYHEQIPALQLAWLFRVRQIAESMAVPRYSEKEFSNAVSGMRSLLIDPQEARHVPRVLMECGVRFVICESLPNSKIDGVCFWLDKSSPVIGMSTRHDRIDNFWFVLRHECEHVLQKHGREQEIVDAELEGDRAGSGESVPTEERIANTAAADFCVTSTEIASFVARKSPFFAERDVLGFARRVGVHPGLVVGQIQNKTKRYDLFRKYLVKVRQFVLPTALVDGWGQIAPVSV